MSDTSDPPTRGPYGQRPLPARADWRRSLDVYVAGRSRGLTADEKWRIAATARSEAAEGRPEGRPGEVDPGQAVYGIAVPRVFDFYRNAGTWRNSLPEPKSPGESATRA